MKHLIVVASLVACSTSEPLDPNPDEGRGVQISEDGKADTVSGSCSAGDELMCGGQSTGNCHCDDRCADYHDCCADAAEVCGVESNRLEDRTAGKPARITASQLEVVANLPYPPGNVTVAPNGRVFVSFFPDSNKGEFQVAEIRNGQAVAFPANEDFQDDLDAVLGLRADGRGRLWLLDHGQVGLHHAKLIAIDVATQAVVFRHEFSREVAGLGSLLNDLVISPDSNFIYISDLSPLAKKPALVIVDLRGATPVVTRKLEKHASVVNGPYDVYVNGREHTFKGVRTSQGVDGLALSTDGNTLYYSSLNSGQLWKIATSTLRSSTGTTLTSAVRKVADITMTDGMIADAAGRVYLTDMEHSTIARVSTTTGALEVVARDARLRWPDGFSFAPDGSLYVTASALHTFLYKLFITETHIRSNGPYQLFRIAQP